MANYRILVIDDTRVIRLSVKTIFEKLGVEVLELDSVEDLFLSVWKYHRIDLLFLDIDLPGMDGLTALEKIKQERALAKVPVIMLTGNSDPQIVKKAIRAGIAGYVRKPFTTENLLERVRPILNLPELSVALPASPAPADQKIKATTAVAPFYAVISLSPDTGIPEGISPLLQPSAESGLQSGGGATVILPFLFAGALEAATESLLTHLRQQGWPVAACKVTETPPLPKSN